MKVHVLILSIHTFCFETVLFFFFWQGEGGWWLFLSY